jgi:hypothetical protein
MQILEARWVEYGLLLCGFLGPLLQLVMDRLVGQKIAGYDFSANSISELGALGSPVRPLVASLSVLATVLMVAFAIGVWLTGGSGVASRTVATLIAANALLALLATLVFPPRFGVRPVFASPGVLIMALSVLCLVAAMIAGAFAFGGWLRVLSAGIPVGYMALGGLRFAIATRSATAGVVMVGAQERTMEFSYLIWVMALALYLL